MPTVPRNNGRPADARKRPSTIADVAKVAQVSISTVSRFLRGEPVRESDRISSAVEGLGYRPNASARHLRSQRTHAIAVVQHDITNPHFAGVVKGVNSVAAEQGYSIYLAEGMRTVEDAVLELASRVDGFICSALTDEGNVLEALRESDKPAVLLEFEPREAGHEFDVVVVAEEKASREAVDYLLRLGHRRIGVIAGPDSTSPGRNRLHGARLALESAGVELSDRFLQVADFTWEGGYQAAARLMASAPAPSAIFACNNLMSLGCLTCLHDLGVRTPEDVSFVGFDPLPSWQLFNPPPTTVERPQSEQGSLAMRLLLNRISGTAVGAPRRIVLDAHLVIRESCAPVVTADRS